VVLLLSGAGEGLVVPHEELGVLLEDILGDLARSRGEISDPVDDATLASCTSQRRVAGNCTTVSLANNQARQTLWPQSV